MAFVHMGNFSPVTELIFQPGYCSYWKFQVGYRTGVFIWENIQLGYGDLGNRASPPFHINT